MPMWSAEILIEMKRALEKSIGLSRSKATYLEREMSRHFPAVATSPWGVEALGPAAFLEELYLAAPMIVTERIEAQALNLARTLHTQLDVLAKAVPSFVEVIRRDLGPRGYRPQA
jgi:hypothetical protein